MNKIYKVIWSKARNCYVVVSEIAKRNGKCSSSLNRKIIASFLAAGLVTALPLGAEAATKIDTNNQLLISASGAGSGLVWGTGNVTNQAYRGTAFGEGTYAQSNNTTAFGYGTYATQHNATAFGKNTYAGSRQSTAFGANTYAGTVFYYNGEKVTPVRRVIDRYLDSSDPDTSTPKEAWVLVKEDGTFVNTGQRFDGDYDAKGDITYSLNYQRMIDVLRNGWYSANGMTSASGDNQRSATAFGEYSIATGQDATAFGYRSAATAWSATAWGHETAALGKRSTAFGVETWASGNNATAFGYRTEATNENTTAWGSNTEASGVGATAWGSHTISGGDNSTTWGKNSEVGSGSLTYNGETYTNLSIQLTTYDGYDDYGSYTQIGHYYVQGRDKDGKLVTIKERDDEGNPIWKWNYNGTADQAEREKAKEWIESQGGTLAGDYSTAFGDSSRVDAENALGALGGTVNVNATNSAAIGKESSVSSANSYAMGNGATIGTGSDGSVALGGQVGTQTTIGTGATNSFAAIGGKVGNDATNAIAVGNNASVTKANSVGIGTNTQATGTTTTAIGNGAKSTANYATSLGSGAAASGANATAVGNTASASAANATAVGDSASASAASALAFGNGATASAENATALGTSANASLENSVALGGSSTTTTGTSVTSATPKSGGITFTNDGDFAGSLTDTNLNRVVSVGASGSTRQIQNVAAGAISPTSTDAINGSQLYAVANQLQWQIGIGKDASSTGTNNVALALSPVGKLNADTDKSNVQIVAGDGIDVSQFTTTDGYGIKVSNHIVKVEHEGLVFKGITTINGTYLTEAEVVDAVNNMITDERAIYASLIPNDVGGGYKIDLISPFLHVNNKAVTDDSGNLSARLFSTATGDSALALGINADAAGKNSIAIGLNADAKGHSEDATTYIEADAATAIGYNAHAHGPGSVAIGAAATTSGNRAIAVGSTARYLDTDTNYTTDNAHQGARAAGQGSIALGDQAKVLDMEYQTDDSKIGSPDYKTNDSIAIGTRTQIQAKNAIALGGNTSYTYVDQASGKSITVYGATDNVFAGNNYGAIVGLGADSGIAIGGAYGSFNSETKKIDQVYDAAEVYGLRGIAIGTGAKVADPNEFKRLTDKLNDATYIEKKEAFEEARSNYFAAKSEYESYETIDPNDPAIPEEMRRNWETNKQLALEALNRAEANMNEATAAYSLALKKVVRTQMDNSMTDTDAVAIGTQAIASVQDSIALGSKAATDENDQAGTTTGLSGYDPLSTTSDNDYFRGDSKYEEDDPVWRSNAGSLSLGGTYTTTDADGKETTTKITRRISNVAAGIDDADVVNVAQLKRATTITTANRSITIGTDAKGERLVSTPYIHTQGVDDSAQYIALVTEYGDVAGYKTGLEKEVSEIQGRIDSINTTKGIINTKKAGLATQLANGEITQAEYDAELAEYNLQLEAIEERLSNLDSSKTAIQDKIDSGEYKTEFETAKTYYDAQATASGKESIAMGHGAKASGKQSVAVGNATTVAGDSSVAIGNSNEVKTANTFVLGNNVTNTVADSVFLGNNTAYVPSGTTTKGIETGYKSADVNGVTFGNFAGGNEVVGVVSVGGEVDGIKTTRRIQNVAPGLVTKDSTDAVNGSQLWAVADKVTNTAKLTPTDEGTVNIEPETGGSNFATAEEVQKAINESGWNVTSSTADKPQTVLVKAGSKVDLKAGAGIKIEQTVSENGTSFTFSANDMGGSTISNVGKATEEGDAVSYGQMKKEAVTDTDHRATTIRTNEKGLQEISSPYIVIHGVRDTRDIEKDENTWAKAGTDAAAMGYKADASGNDSVAFGSGAKALATKSVSLGNNNEVSAGADGGLAVGSGNTVSGTNGIAVGTNLTVGGNNSGAIGDPTVVNATNSYSVGNGNTLAAGQTDVFAFGNGITETTDNSVFLGSGAKYTKGATTAGMDTYDSVTVNGVTHNFAGGRPEGVVSVGSGEVTAANDGTRRIQNVAAGKISPESTDSINGSQLYSAMSNVNNNVTNLGNQISNVENRTKKGLAGAAALAALHPMDFDPDDKLTFAAGMGHYRGENAAALGMFYRPDEKVMFSVGGTLGNGENMINAGISFSLDRTPRKTSSRTAMAREIVELREQVAQLTAIVNQLAGGQLPKPPVMFPNTPENAWAYEYLENLQMKGNIVGYTGRELTRNEFAAALDRAMMSGAKLDERLIKEFEPELSHVRVSHVAGKGEDEGGWYERPRTSHDKLENQHEIAKKPLRPQEKSVTSKS